MAIKKIQRGKPLEELVKGSMEYTMSLIREAFAQQFPYRDGHDYYIVDTFADSVVVREYGSDELKPDEYYLVGYQRQADGYVFANRDAWETVELAYQPMTQSQPMSEGKTVKGKRLVEEIGSARLLEAANASGDEPRTIRAIGITADVVNGNGRRYSAQVLRTAVAEAQQKMSGSLSQGRLLQLLGEPEHPSSKSGRPNILETVIRWEAISFNESTKQVELEGIILPTSKGRDILALLENGVQIPLSQRAYGQSKNVKENGVAIEEVHDLHITGYDAVMEPSDPVAQIVESKVEEPMDPEEIKKMLLEALQKNPELVKNLVKGDIEKMGADQLKAVEEQVRKALGVAESEDLSKALSEAAAAKRTLDAQKRQAVVDEAVTLASKDLPYGEKLNKLFVDGLKSAGLETAEAVKTFAESKRKEYDSIAASGVLSGLGFKSVQPVGPVIEQETGYPEFARASFELTESIRQQTWSPRRDFRTPKTLNEAFTAKYLEAYDKAYKNKLLAEARMFNEAEQTTDLDLPYSVMRAIIAEAFPTLVATGIFDVQLSDQNPAHLYYETFAGETGYTVAAAAEAVTATALGAWYDMDFKRITPGTVVVKNHAENVTYTEGTDYLIDYANGKILALATGTILAGADLHITAYTYTAVRKGEMSPIERGKMTLAHATLELMADRLATEISREAVVFSRSQLGYDATARTLSSLVRQVQRKIDQGILYQALSAALSVASNSGGTWTAANDPVQTLVNYIGVAKVLVSKRFYTPTSVLLSATNADKLANWDGFTQAGSRPDADINAEGYVGRIKGLPVFQSTEASDGYGLIVNRELVMHRIGQPMQLFGPFPSYEAATGKLIAANQYYAEEFNGTSAPVPQKSSYVKIA